MEKIDMLLKNATAQDLRAYIRLLAPSMQLIYQHLVTLPDGCIVIQPKIAIQTEANLSFQRPRSHAISRQRSNSKIQNGQSNSNYVEANNGFFCDAVDARDQIVTMLYIDFPCRVL